MATLVYALDWANAMGQLVLGTDDGVLDANDPVHLVKRQLVFNDRVPDSGLDGCV